MLDSHIIAARVCARQFQYHTAAKKPENYQQVDLHHLCLVQSSLSEGLFLPDNKILMIYDNDFS